MPNKKFKPLSKLSYSTLCATIYCAVIFFFFSAKSSAQMVPISSILDIAVTGGTATGGFPGTSYNNIQIHASGGALSIRNGSGLSPWQFTQGLFATPVINQNPTSFIWESGPTPIDFYTMTVTADRFNPLPGDIYYLYGLQGNDIIAFNVLRWINSSGVNRFRIIGAEMAQYATGITPIPEPGAVGGLLLLTAVFCATIVYRMRKNRVGKNFASGDQDEKSLSAASSVSLLPTSSHLPGTSQV